MCVLCTDKYGNILFYFLMWQQNLHVYLYVISVFFGCIFWCAQAPSLVSLHTMFSTYLVLGIIVYLKALKCAYSLLYLKYLRPG
jgi:hypothetical protein